MQTFTKAIVRKVPKTLSDGITSVDLGSPDYGAAREQHGRYVDALEECGLEVAVLEADEEFPDSVFIEDTAIVTGRCAVITNPGAQSRRGEVDAIAEALPEYYDDLERIYSPGVLDGGDVLQVGDLFYIGLTQRTNPEGAEQLAGILREHDFDAKFVRLSEFLHLKSGVAYLGGDDLLVAGEMANHEAFDGYNKIVVSPAEEYSANCIRVNGHVLVPAGYEKTAAEVEGRGYEVIELEMSEFQKVDGGLSCLSLRLE